MTGMMVFHRSSFSGIEACATRKAGQTSSYEQVGIYLAHGVRCVATYRLELDELC